MFLPAKFFAPPSPNPGRLIRYLYHPDLQNKLTQMIQHLKDRKLQDLSLTPKPTEPATPPSSISQASGIRSPLPPDTSASNIKTDSSTEAYTETTAVTPSMTRTQTVTTRSQRAKLSQLPPSPPQVPPSPPPRPPPPPPLSPISMHRQRKPPLPPIPNINIPMHPLHETADDAEDDVSNPIGADDISNPSMQSPGQDAISQQFVHNLRRYVNKKHEEAEQQRSAATTVPGNQNDSEPSKLSKPSKTNDSSSSNDESSDNGHDDSTFSGPKPTLLDMTQRTSSPNRQDENDIDTIISSLNQDHQKAINDIDTQQFLNDPVDHDELQYVKNHVPIDIAPATTPPTTSIKIPVANSNNDFLQSALSQIQIAKDDMIDHINHLQLQHVANLEQIQADHNKEMEDKIHTFTSLVNQHESNKAELLAFAEQQKAIIRQAVVDSNRDIHQARAEVASDKQMVKKSIDNVQNTLNNLLISIKQADDCFVELWAGGEPVGKTFFKVFRILCNFLFDFFPNEII